MKFTWALPLVLALATAMPNPAAEPGLDLIERDDDSTVVPLAADAAAAGCVKRCNMNTVIGPAACNPQGCNLQNRNGNCKHLACPNGRRQVCQNGFDNRCYFSV